MERLLFVSPETFISRIRDSFLVLHGAIFSKRLIQAMYSNFSQLADSKLAVLADWRIPFGVPFSQLAVFTVKND